MTFHVEIAPDGAGITLRGDCRMEHVAELEQALATVARRGAPALSCDAAAAGEFDIGPAWLLHRFLERRRATGVAVVYRGPPLEHSELFERLEADAGEAPAPRPEQDLLTQFGRRLQGLWHGLVESLSFGGATLAAAGAVLTDVRRLRLPSIVRHVYETGVQAIPVVGVIALLISVITAYIGAQQLKPLGAEMYTVDLITIGTLREMGVLLTAIMVAGRTGSAYAAEIGVMKLNDEVDALEAMGVSAFEVLVLPRVIALIIAMPLLTIVADALGLIGGGLLTRTLLDLSWTQFFSRLDAAVDDTTFWAGLVKAPVFGALIGLTGTLRGLQVRDSSRELGRLTTVAVVQSIFLVIFADALFAIFYLHIDF